MKLKLTFLRSFLSLFLLLVTSSICGAQDGVDRKSPSGGPTTAKKKRTAATSPKRNRKETADKKPDSVVVKPKPTAAESAAMGYQLFMKQDYATAEPYYRDAVALEPDNATYNYYLGAAMFRLQRYADAEPYLRKAMTLLPSNAALRKDLATNFYRQQKYLEAEEQIRAAARLEPSNANYQSQVGLILYYQQKYTEAEMFFREALRLDPSNAGDQKNLEVTQSALKAAEKLNPDAAMHNSRGNVLFNQAKYGPAEAEYREALRLDPQSADYKNNLARASAARQKTSEYKQNPP